MEFKITEKIKGHYSILAGWVIDGMGGHVQKNMVLEVEDGTLVSFHKRKTGNLDQKYEFDFSNGTIFPGLIDCHVHLFMAGTNSRKIRQGQLQATFDSIRHVISLHLRQQLKHGIVAVRDGGDYAGHALRYKNEYLGKSGLPVMIKSPGKAWRKAGRYGKLIGRPPLNGETLVEAVKRWKGQVDHIKIVNSGLNSLKEFGKETLPQFTKDQLRETCSMARKAGLPVMVHANGILPVKLAIEAGCDSIEHGFFMGNENLKLMAEKQIIWVPTAYTMKAYSQYLDPADREVDIAKKNLDHQLDQIRRAVQYGVPMAVGTDCGSLGVHHGAAFMEETSLLMTSLNFEKAIRCGTLNGAKLLGLERDMGSLSTGRSATFVVSKGSPSDLLNKFCPPFRIFIKGRQWTDNS